MSGSSLIGRRACCVALVATVAACGDDESDLLPQLQSIEVTPAAPSIALGLGQQFTATGRFSNGSTADLTRSVRWTSSDPGVATVDESTGLVQSAGVGSTQIGAASGSVAGSAGLEVTPPALQALAITPAAVYAGIGIDTQLAASGTFSDGTTSDLTGQVAWASPSAAVALGPRPGQVSGLALASTTIEASLGSVRAQAPLAIVADAWSPAPRPSFGNAANAAVLLKDGRVLVLQGSSAAIYDPAANRWSASRASGSSATVLADGRVMVVGGSLATVAWFDPSTDAWSAAASPPRIGGSTATFLADGGVLLVGGSSAERYDPLTDSWTPAGNLSTVRTQYTATRLADGRVLVAGGARTASAEIYDPATNSWTQTAPMKVDRYQHTATLLRDGRVLVVGGVRHSWNIMVREELNDWASGNEIYDPIANTWTGAKVSGARFQHSASLLPDGRVLVAGGGAWYYFGPGTPDDLTTKALRSVAIYDPVAGSSTSAADMLFERLGHVAVLLPGGKTLVIGGHGLETRLVFRDPGLPRVVTREVAVPDAEFYW